MTKSTVTEKALHQPFILCVDDEKIILDSLKLQLSNYFEGGCQIEQAESGEEALEILRELSEEKTEVHVIISDQIMPQMKGDAFLAKASQDFPESLRILLTGQADKDDIINAINKAGLYRYIPKPWDTADLNLTVKEALRSYLNSKRIREQRDELLILNRDLETKVQERTHELVLEKDKSELLLHNILPRDIAQELKNENEVKPRHYDLATIAFMDIVGFTSHSKNLTPNCIVEELNNIFHLIDEVVEQHDLEKIKTMGDGYMFGGGIPVENKSNPVDVVQACLEIQEKMRFHRIRNRRKSLPPWDLRIGIHSGELVAGVIGKKKFAYDVWGNTVNTASRIESSGVAGEVNISSSTYHLVKDHFDCTTRGKLQVKNMGSIEMYFVTARKMVVL